MVTAEEKLAVIREYVLRKRAHCGIIALGRIVRPELSCEAVGEFYNLVERQLLTTEEGFGAWPELNYPPVLEGAYRHVIKRGFGGTDVPIFILFSRDFLIGLFARGIVWKIWLNGLPKKLLAISIL